MHKNKINDITPLYDYNNGGEEKENKEEKKPSGTIFKKLESLTLKNYSMNLKEKLTYDFLDSLKNKDSLILIIMIEKKEHTGEAKADQLK